MTERMGRRLLIVSCSKRKRDDSDLLPALERYDGPSFRVIRKAMREGRWGDDTDLLILSARYGLIEPYRPIPYYHQRMTRNRATQLRQECLKRLEARLSSGKYERVFLNLGRDYLSVISGWESLDSRPEIVQYAQGGIGCRISQMKNWINWRASCESSQDP